MTSYGHKARAPRGAAGKFVRKNPIPTIESLAAQATALYAPPAPPPPGVLTADVMAALPADFLPSPYPASAFETSFGPSPEAGYGTDEEEGPKSVFYCPSKPEMCLQFDETRRRYFRRGELALGPGEADHLRKVNRHYIFEANPSEPAIPCPVCGVEWRHREAMKQHIGKHIKEAAERAA